MKENPNLVIMLFDINGKTMYKRICVSPGVYNLKKAQYVALCSIVKLARGLWMKCICKDSVSMPLGGGELAYERDGDVHCEI